MGNVYISFLGTSDYVPCTYYMSKENFECENVRFVQEATVRIACKEWSSDDRIIIFTTQEAYNKNWLNNGHIDKRTGKRLNRRGLMECLSDPALGLSCEIVQKGIPDGKSEEEIWEIFNIVFRALREGDEVVFDITHAFRSLPMLAVVILNYAKVTKWISLKAVYYGAFEVIGTPQEAKNIPLERRRAPIFDLTVFDQLIDWTVAIDRFIESGDAALIERLTKSGRVKEILAETKGGDANAAAIRDIGRTLKSFCDALATCRGPEISPIAMSLQRKLQQCEDTGLLPPFQPLFGLLEKSISSFTGQTIVDGLTAAKWCFEHSLLQQAYTILQETLISHMVLAVGGDPMDLVQRDIASQAIKIKKERLPEEEWHPPAKDNKEMTWRHLNLLGMKSDLVAVMYELSQYRNDLNHAGYNRNIMKSQKFSSKLGPLLAKVEDLVSKHEPQ